MNSTTEASNAGCRSLVIYYRVHENIRYRTGRMSINEGNAPTCLRVKNC